MSGLKRDDIIRMAREAGEAEGLETVIFHPVLERFAALVAAAEREKVAQWMIQRSYATGHGDALEDLLAELDWQITDDWNRALRNGMRTEREACAKLVDEEMADYRYGTPPNIALNNAAAAIRARLNAPEPAPVADKYLMEVECTKCGAKQDGVLTVTAPPQREFIGLTDDEVKDIVWNLPYEPSQEHIRAIEAKLQEKNG